MRVCVLILLLAFAPAWAEPRFGTEIELKNRVHHVSEMCMRAALVAAPVGIGSGLNGAWSERGSDQRAASMTTAKVSAAVVGLCMVQFLVVDPANSRRLLRLIEENLQERMKKGELLILRDDRAAGRSFVQPLTLIYPGNVMIILTADFATIEVKMPPTTGAQFSERRDVLQRELYDNAAEVGLRAPTRDGMYNGGHIHVDIESAFDRDPLKFKRFVLDTWKNGGIFRGPLGDSGLDSLMISTEAERRKVEELVRHLDQLAQQGKKLSEAELSVLIGKFPELFRKGHLISLHPDIGTLELRGFRSQPDATTLALVSALLTQRIEYTNALPETPFRGSDIPLGWGTDAARGKLFRRYIVEMNGNPAFAQLAPVRFRSDEVGCGPEYRRVKAASGS